jgi:hypothetical protein
MKILKVIIKSFPYIYNVPEAMFGIEWTKFKFDYQFHIEKAISEAQKLGRGVAIIDIEKLPVLSENLKELKSFMDIAAPGQQYTVSQYNSRREEAKNFFTFPCICEMDASGYIKQLIK